MAVTDWSTIADNNTSIDGINIAEFCPSANLNNAIRSVMAAVASFVANGVITVLSTGTLTVTTAMTAVSGLFQQTNAGNRIYPLQLNNASNAGATGVGIDFNPSSNAAGVRSAQIVAYTNGASQVSFDFLASNAAAPTRIGGLSYLGNLDVAGYVGAGRAPLYPIDSTLTTAGSRVIVGHFRNNSSTANTGVIIDLNASANEAGVRSAQLWADNNGASQYALSFALSNGAAPARVGGINYAGNLDVTGFLGSGRAPQYPVDSVLVNSGNRALMGHFQNNASVANTGVALDLNPSTLAAGTRSAQIWADNAGGNLISLSFAVSNSAAPARVGGFSGTGALDCLGALTVNGGWITLPEIAAASVPTPAAGRQSLYINSADHRLYRKDSTGAVTVIA